MKSKVPTTVLFFLAKNAGRLVNAQRLSQRMMPLFFLSNPDGATSWKM